MKKHFLALLLFFSFLLACDRTAPGEGEGVQESAASQEEGEEQIVDHRVELRAIDPVLLTGVHTDWSLAGTGIERIDSIQSVPGLQVEHLPEGLRFSIVGDIGLINVVTLYTPQGRVDLLVRDAGSIPVPFRLKDMGYEEVRVEGDMNAWDTSRGLMVKKGKVWELLFPLPPGRYKYRFVVDGKPILDPKNPRKGKNERGEEVSVYEVKGRAKGGKGLPEVDLLEKDGNLLRLHLPKGGAVIALLNNRQLQAKVINDEEVWVQLPPNARGLLRVYAQNEVGLSELWSLELE